MGNRAIYVFIDENHSPGIYVHWAMPRTDLSRAQTHFRTGDASYSAARFCGVMHSHIGGNLGIGLLDSPRLEQYARNYERWDRENGLDVGVIEVDVRQRPFIVMRFTQGERVGRWELPGVSACDE